MSRPPAILVISQASSLPARRRTWQQVQALAARGWTVRVLCPARPGEPRREMMEGIAIRRYRPLVEGASPAGLLAEYAQAMLAITLLALRARFRGRIDVVQVVNPPDWLILPALLLRLTGARVVFDLADLSSLLVAAKFPRARLLRRLIAGLERWALARADLVLTANELYRRMAVRIGRREPGTTWALPSYPAARPATAMARLPRPVRIGYFGIVGRHDGVERLLDAVERLDAMPELPDFELVIVGDGPALAGLRRHPACSGLRGRIHFTGFLEGAAREAALAGFAIAVIPDPVTRYTRTISMNKVFAYAAHGCAIVSTPLRQTRRLLGDAAAWTTDDSPQALAATLARLLADPGAREQLGEAARLRADIAFRWGGEADRYAAAMAGLLDAPALPPLPVRRSRTA